MFDFQLRFYQVKVGNMYYVQGLNRHIVGCDDEFLNLEFSTYPDVACLLVDKTNAEDITSHVGGIVETQVMQDHKYNFYYALREWHVNSEVSYLNYMVENHSNELWWI